MNDHNSLIMTCNMADFDDTIIQTLKGLGYLIKSDKQTGLTIAKTTDNVTEHYFSRDMNHGRLDLKGLILTSPNEEGEIHLVAPGCKVPLEEENGNEVAGYTNGCDGIMYRFYQHDGQWQFSTTGRIVPDTFWGPRGTPTFLALAQDAVDAGLVDYQKLTPGYCYYAVLESPDFTNLVKHNGLRLTLVNIIDCSTKDLRNVPLEQDQAFKMHQQLLPEVPEFAAEAERALALTNLDVGFTIHYTDGSIFRKETAAYKRASEIRPNLTDPAQQWVSLLLNGGQPQIQEFLTFFPWNQPLFDRCQTKFDALVATVVENYKELDQKGWRGVCVPARHVSYMRDLMDEVQTDIASTDLEKDIREHILNEDAKRIYYLINPYDGQPRVRDRDRDVPVHPGQVTDGQMTI